LHDQAIRQARDPNFPTATAGNIAAAMHGMMPGPVDAGARRFAPVEWADRIRVPTLVLDTDVEPLFDKGKHALASLERIKAAGAAPVAYDMIPGTTHGAELYEGMTAAGSAGPFVDRAVDWFKRHL
jgi:alpha-beta hydrolase superfamily lysophospholipase